MIDRKLVQLLVCPSCRGGLQLRDHGQQLVCEAEQLAYPVREDIPLLLAQEAQAWTGSPETSPSPNP